MVIIDCFSKAPVNLMFDSTDSCLVLFNLLTLQNPCLFLSHWFRISSIKFDRFD